MVYILELKTTQASAIKIVTDAINSLLTDANFDFYPYYIENNDSKDDLSNSENDSNYESESDNESSDNKKKINYYFPDRCNNRCLSSTLILRVCTSMIPSSLKSLSKRMSVSVAVPTKLARSSRLRLMGS